MKRYKSILLVTALPMMSMYFCACDGPSNLAPIESVDNSPSIISDAISAHSVADIYVDAQKCILSKDLPNTGEPGTPYKPTPEDIKNAHQILDAKRSDKKNAEKATAQLSVGCNQVEIKALHDFLTCQSTACKKASNSMTDVLAKAIDCKKPTTEKPCENAFMEFIYYFLPMPDMSNPQ